MLSTRSNVIVIADEAHRSQYGFADGFARYLAEALPNALRLGFTGTPDQLRRRRHRRGLRRRDPHLRHPPVAGRQRHRADLLRAAPGQAAPDEARHRRGAAGDRATASEIGRPGAAQEPLGRAGRGRRRRRTASTSWPRDLLAHFLDRTATLARQGDGRVHDARELRPAVRRADGAAGLPRGQDRDDRQPRRGPAGVERARATSPPRRSATRSRSAWSTPTIRSQIVIVCDMWLTGTDIPCLHTLYVDKPMQGHNMIQAISRVNRVFRDKPHGLIVDYIGIGDELREATAQYTQGGGKGEPAPDIAEAAVPLFLDEPGRDPGDSCPRATTTARWRRLEPDRDRRPVRAGLRLPGRRRRRGATSSSRPRRGSRRPSCWSSTWTTAAATPTR